MGHDNENNPSKTIPPPARAGSFSWPEIRTQSQLQQTAETLQSGGKIYPAQSNKIGEILKSLGVIDDKILDAVAKRHHTKKANDKPTGELLVYMGIIEPEVLVRALCIQAGVPMVDAEAVNIPYDALKFVSNDNAREKRTIPVGVYKGTLYLAVADPLNFPDQQFFKFSTGLMISPVFASNDQIDTCLNTKWEADTERWAG